MSSYVAESRVPVWNGYRDWFREQWAAGGPQAWAVALVHLLVGLFVFDAVVSFDLATLPVGGSLIVLVYTALLAVLLYAATAPPAEPYVSWLDEKWMESDVDKLFIVLGHVVVAFFVLAWLLDLPFNGFAGALASVLFFTAVYAMLVLALNIHWGYAGIFNIGVVGFMAVGVYTMAIVSTPPEAGPATFPGLGLPLPVGILLGVLAAALVGAIAALPALRLRADYFAIVTVALSEMLRISIKSTALQKFTIAGVAVGTGGAQGKNMPANPFRLLFFASHDPGAEPALLGSVLFPLFRGLSITVVPKGAYLFVGIGYVKLPAFTLDLAVEPPVLVNLGYILVLTVFVGLFYWLLVRLGNSPFGRVLKAIREDEEVAQSLGKDTRSFKLIAFAFGCGLMGLAGILWIGSQGYTNPTFFKPLITFYVWIALIIGGAGSNTGSVLGASLFASALFTGPLYLKNVIENFLQLKSSPDTVAAAVGPLFAGKIVPLFAYLVDNIANMRMIFIGVLLIWLMQNRPEGLLGHRKEEAAAIPLTRPGGGDDE